MSVNTLTYQLHREENVTVIDDVQLSDGMGEHWSPAVVASFVEKRPPNFARIKVS